MTDNEKVYALVLIWLPVGIMVAAIGILYWAISGLLEAL